MHTIYQTDYEDCYFILRYELLYNVKTDLVKVNNCMVVYNRVNLLWSNAIFSLPGVPCEILSMENDVIKCQTMEAPLANKYGFYSGKHNLLPVHAVHDVINTEQEL